MKKPYLLAAYAAVLAITACTDNEYINDTANPQGKANQINFAMKTPALTRGDIVGASAAELLGGNFIVMGTKGTEAADAPSSTVVFDNYLVTYEANSAGKTDSNSHNWEYVGNEIGSILVPAATWNALHAATTDAKSQTIKFWDYSTSQYDFIAYSTGTATAVTETPTTGQVQVTRIATGTTLSTAAYSFTAPSVDELKQVYVTDITPVKKAQYGNVVTLKFKNLTSKIRLGIYETVPGYSVSNVEFYTDDATLISADVSANKATLFSDNDTTDGIPTSGTVAVYYPHIGTGNASEADYNKASVTVTAGSTKTSTMGFGDLADFASAESHEATGNYIGRTLPTATMAGDKTKAYYQNVIPNSAGQTLTLRVNYTLTSIDGSGETINVYGAKAVVPATYTKWQPNYAYTYIFKITDNTNGWTSKVLVDDDDDPSTPDVPANPAGLHPITFDAVVVAYEDATAEQTTVTTVAAPSITTYQQGHTKGTNEYSIATGNNIYVQVMDNSTATATLVGTLSATNSLLYSVSKATATEAEVMDALQNRTNDKDAVSPIGRNGITLTTNSNIDNTVDEIVNGVNDDAIGITAGQAAAIDITALSAGTYAYVYVPTAATADEAIYQCVTPADNTDAAKYYEVTKANIDAVTSPCAEGAKADAGKVYFVKNVDAECNFVSYTFKQTKVNDDVKGLYEVAIPSTKATAVNTGSFYFDVYNQNNGKYAVKVIKIVA